uniref:Uncharacterized protein n=1 Tax=Avena sativa TaxID=4498 RepID=A0ACD5WDZ3_AVESA
MPDDHDYAEQRDEENLHDLPEEPKQDRPQLVVPPASSKGRYARSRAGWFSKERSTPEGINMEEHGWRFEQRLPTPKYDHESSSDSDWDTPVVLRERKPLEFELVEVRVISIFFEFGAGCIHYNFTAKQPEDHNPADDAGVPKLFFSELDHRALPWLRRLPAYRSPK